MADFISNIDPRHNDLGISRDNAAKLYRFHVQTYGVDSCCIEEDGVELDPVEDC